jgi:8-oxo-dGTP pyrophosphatase MutT (NUDIX family)
MRPWKRLQYWACRLWWRIARPLTLGARVILVQEGRVLLVRHTYRDSWFLPGGGVRKGEAIEAAARREAAEEVGATLGRLRLLGIYSNFFEHKSDHIAVFVCDDFTLTGRTDAEIDRFRFFPPDAFPEGTSPGTRRRVEEYAKGGHEPITGNW